MTVAIHQPNFLPWLGYFYKLSICDCFVFLDDAQFSKNSFINRNKIKTPRGADWLTLPVQSSGKFGQNINEVRINNFADTNKKILTTIKMNYSKAEYFKQYFPELEEIFNNSSENLSELNINLILWIYKILQINKQFYYSSKILDVQGSATEKLISICEKLECNTYLSGFGGLKYQEEELFSAANIELKIYNFNHPQYSQLWGEFLPNLSILDLILNCGEEGRDLLGAG
ncbi:MAG: WbqC family protein [Ignavibacteria bacterium]|nr:WbqC family protein [Ignavibacteria bacterium]